MRRVIACQPVLLLLLTSLAPAHASRWLAVGNGAHDLAVVDPAGDVTIFSGPSMLLARHSFGAGVLSITMSPVAPVVAVLRRTDKYTVDCWDYLVGRVRTAGPELVDGSAAVTFAEDGRSLYVAAADKQMVREIGDFLLPERLIAAPRMNLATAGIELALSNSGLYCAAASSERFWLGPARGSQLQRYEVLLSAHCAPTLRFSRDARWLLAAGDCSLVMAPSLGGAARQVPLTSVKPSPAADLTEDGKTIYLAQGNRFYLIEAANGAVASASLVRADPANAIDAAVVEKSGTFAILYDDGRVVWFYPGSRTLAACYPPLGGTPGPLLPPVGPPPGPLVPVKPPVEPVHPPVEPVKPPAPTDPCQAAAAALADKGLFTSDTPQTAVLLDGNYARLKDLEALVAETGWQALVKAVLATWFNKPALLPPAYQGLNARLALVELVELRSVHPQPAATPGQFEALLGPAVDTKTVRMGVDNHIWPVWRFGVFGIALDKDGGRFPEKAMVILDKDTARLALPPAK